MHLACPGLLPILGSGTTVVTPSRLLARVARHDFSRDRLSKGVETWRRPGVYNVGAWLKIGWQNARYSGAGVPALLSEVQEEALWQRIIEQQTPGLFDTESTAALASRASALIAEWHIPLEHDAWRDHEDGQHFRNWHATFRKLCKEEGWICASDLWRLVPQWIASGYRTEPSIAFAGFNDTTPALSRLLETLGSRARALGIEERVPAEIIPARRCNDFAEEIETAARWARSVFEADPKSSIGIFVPDLATNRRLVERVFEQICYPSARRSESVFHLHPGAPLRENPLIAGALVCLRVASSRIAISDAGAILRSPWLTGAADERSERALADFELRRSRELDVSLRDLEYRGRGCPQLLKLFQYVREVLRNKPPRADFGFWSEFFSDLLAAVGWPGDADLSADQQNIVETWKDNLSVFSSLSLVSPPASYQQALRRLESLLNDPGLAVGDLFSPIQILDVSQAAGLDFDRVFVCGVSEENSFFNSSTSSLIPLKLQRACEIPGATAASTINSRARVLTGLFSAAPSVYASYSNRMLPAAEKFLSTGREEIPLWQGRTAKQSFAPADLETFEDANAPRYIPGGTPLGGTGLIKDQSQCPFRAFAIRRLNARSPEEGSFGLDSRDRGGFAHEALRNLWRELKTQDNLKNYRPLLLPSLVHEAVVRAIPSGEKKGPLREQSSLAEIERLVDVISDWLKVELERKQPFEVEVTEQNRSFQIAGLDLHLRIDRIDRLRNRKALLIDYKSGDTKAASLDGDRPCEPQLLVYAAAMRDEVDGIFFAQLKPRNARLTGYSRDLQIDKKCVKPHWDTYLSERIEIVERIARSFVKGEAAVNPLPHACEFCEVKPFCRVKESAGHASEGELDD